MANPTGIINGTKFLLLKGLSPIGAVVSNSQAFNRALIEITNKDSEQNREYLTGDEGTKTMDISIECLFTTNSAFVEMRDSFLSGSIDEYSVAIDGVASANSFFAKVENFSDSSNLNEATKASFSLKSSSSFADNYIPSPALFPTALLHFNGNDGEKIFTDEVFGNIWTPNSPNTTLSSTQTKFGSTSCSSEFLTGLATTDITITSTNTFECWVYPTTTDGSPNVIFSSLGASTPYSIVYRNGRFRFEKFGLLQIEHQDTSDRLNMWTHIAFVTDDGIQTLYVDGVPSDTTDSESEWYSAATPKFTIGGDSFTTANEFIGYIDEFRIVDGTALYTEAFTPPIAQFVSL